MSRELILIGVMAGVTIVLRFSPFLIFGKRETPAFLTYLGNVLPYAVMAMLVVYCVKDINMSSVVMQMVSIAVVVLLHIWKRNTLLSIVAGTVCYMVMIRLL